MSKQLSIIIINYNTLALTKQCIASIFKHCNEELFEIIVVDNASTKEDPADTWIEGYIIGSKGYPFDHE